MTVVVTVTDRPLSSLPGASLDVGPPSPENDPAARGGEFDSQSNLEFLPLTGEDLGEPMKQLTLQPQQARLQRGNRICFPNPPWPHELHLVFPMH